MSATRLASSSAGLLSSSVPLLLSDCALGFHWEGADLLGTPRGRLPAGSPTLAPVGAAAGPAAQEEVLRKGRVCLAYLLVAAVLRLCLLAGRADTGTGRSRVLMACRPGVCSSCFPLSFFLFHHVVKLSLLCCFYEALCLTGKLGGVIPDASSLLSSNLEGALGQYPWRSSAHKR